MCASHVWLSFRNSGQKVLGGVGGQESENLSPGKEGMGRGGGGGKGLGSRDPNLL